MTDPRRPPAPPRPGDVVRLDGTASVQFAGDRALLLRVTAVSTAPTYAGWAWLTGYVLRRDGTAAARREVYVQLAGLRPVRPGAAVGSAAPAPRSTGGTAPGVGARVVRCDAEPRASHRGHVDQLPRRRHGRTDRAHRG